MQSNSYNYTICLLILFISIILTLSHTTYTTHSSCTHCNLTQCLNPTNCLHGVTYDQCHCCKVCLRQLGQTCGKQIGRCAKGLQCLKSDHLGPILTNSVLVEKTTGICGRLNCTGVKCSNASSLTSVSDNFKCHNDSYRLSTDGFDSCCAECACLPGICNTSGNPCPSNKIARIVRPGNWTPGSCCDLIECIDAPTHCFHNNNKYLHEEKWKIDKCTTCSCKDGVTRCQKKQCNIVQNCSAVVVVNGDCCPTCQGCISSNGSFYNNTQNWYEDDCTYCECNSGKISCKVEMCQSVSCDKPIILPGHCCPTCQTCDLHCPQGYKKDSMGNEICECNNCLSKQDDCLLSCPSGFKRGQDGCEICECEAALYDLNTAIEDTGISKIEDKLCTLSNGTIYENGHYWHDGCRECLCNNGKIMCTKPECPTIKCLDSIIIDGQCCPTCSNREATNSNTVQSTGIIESTHLNSHLFITANIFALIITIILLGIFILLAYIAIVKIMPTKNPIIQHSMKENAIMLWQNNPNPIQIPHLQSQDNHLVTFHVGNKTTNLIKPADEQTDDFGSFRDRLLTRSCSCPDKCTVNLNN